MLQKMGHFSLRLAFELMSRQQCQFPKIFPKFLRKSWSIHFSHKWPNLEANHGSKWPKSWGGLAIKRRPKMLQKMGHFRSRLASEMAPRRKCQFPRFCQFFEEIPLNSFVSKNGPIWQLIADRNFQNRGGDLALKKRPKMFQKMGHFSSRLASGMMSRRKCEFFQDFSKNIDKILANPFVSKNDPIRQLIAARNYPDRGGGGLALKRRPQMLQINRPVYFAISVWNEV